MNFRATIIFFCLFNLFSLRPIHGQSMSNEAIDSLAVKSFEYLKNQFLLYTEKPNKAKLYADAYLRKAKKKENVQEILTGYFWYAYVSDFKTAITYYDSIITYKTTINELLPLAHEQKGFLYYNNGNFRKSLDSYLQAREISKKKGKYQVLLTSTHSIALIKSLIGQKEEALEIHIEQYKNFSTQALKTEFSNYYLESLFGLADSYRENSKLDSASIYNKIGIQESIRIGEPSFYPRFVLNEGVILYEKKHFKKANDSLSKAIEILDEIEDYSSLALGYFYKAQIQEQSGDLISAIDLLKRADTIISKQSIQPDFSPIYESLYEIYKQTDSVEKQLVYLEKFIDYNKKLEKEFDGIDLEIYKQYDTPLLVESKEKIIQGLESKNKTNRRNILLLSIFLGMFSILSFYYYRKRFVYKKRYDKLVQQEFDSPKSPVAPIQIKKSSKIPAEVLEQLLPKIEAFEKSKGFLDSSITLNKMAKLLGSNSNYLSKTINHTKNKNFSSYLSDLRIEYAIQELKTDSKLLNYTIKAIAGEVGFGNTESFTRAFYSKTNLYPSYFIKQLKKRQ